MRYSFFIILFLASCSPQTPNDISTISVEANESISGRIPIQTLPRLETYPADIPPPASIFSGFLSINNGCVVFEDVLSGVKAVALFPSGTDFTQDRYTIVTAFGDRLTLGETYKLQGALGGMTVETDGKCPNDTAILGPIIKN